MIYLIIGVLFGSVGILIIQCLCEVLNAFTEFIKVHIAYGIAKCSNKIDELEAPEESHVNAIGFTADFEEDEYDDDE